ncbi:HNH endonuclease signature motif containing protein [Candidatus Poriferisodalis sp.]|uniref:HNH endonuclease signature motif containing protein n=1 Tax=Candidatus Poriferisodalis sp. TaxID=3101277 RepID=UPI003AF8A110
MFADLLYRLDADGSEPAETGFEGAGAGSAWPDPAAVWRFDDSHPDSHPDSHHGCADAAGSPDDAGAMAGPGAAQNGSLRDGSLRDGSLRDGSLRDGGWGAVAEPGPSAGSDGTAAAGCGVDGSEGLASLGYGDLKDLVVELAAERARVEGRYLAAVGEMASRNGAQSAAFVLRDQTRLNASQARSEARLGEDLVSQGMTATLDAMRVGEIGMSHARVIAREAPKKHRRSEADFIELCRIYPSDKVASYPLAYQSQEVFADLDAEAAAAGLGPVDAELALQRAQRWGSMKLGDDGMWHLTGTFDFLAGRQVNTALQAMMRSLRRRAENTYGTANDSNANGATAGHDDSNADTDGGGAGVVPTRAQLTADAISDLIAGTTNIRRARTSLVIVADYDVVNDRLTNPRLDDGTPISARMLADHAADANVLPAIFKADWSELALGPTRNASDAQRLILAMRDGGCIGCDLTPEHTEAHHIDYFENGGPTEIPNLASLCFDCHSDLHQHGRQIETPPDGRPRLRPPEPHSTGPPARAPAASRSP